MKPEQAQLRIIAVKVSTPENLNFCPAPPPLICYVTLSKTLPVCGLCFIVSGDMDTLLNTRCHWLWQLALPSEKIKQNVWLTPYSKTDSIWVQDLDFKKRNQWKIGRMHRRIFFKYGGGSLCEARRDSRNYKEVEWQIWLCKNWTTSAGQRTPHAKLQGQTRIKSHTEGRQRFIIHNILRAPFRECNCFLYSTYRDLQLHYLLICRLPVSSTYMSASWKLSFGLSTTVFLELGQHLAHSRCSISTCWRSESMSLWSLVRTQWTSHTEYGQSIMNR